MAKDRSYTEKVFHRKRVWGSKSIKYSGNSKGFE